MVIGVEVVMAVEVLVVGVGVAVVMDTTVIDNLANKLTDLLGTSMLLETVAVTYNPKGFMAERSIAKWGPESIRQCGMLFGIGFPVTLSLE